MIEGSMCSGMSQTKDRKGMLFCNSPEIKACDSGNGDTKG